MTNTNVVVGGTVTGLAVSTLFLPAVITFAVIVTMFAVGIRHLWKLRVELRKT